MVGALYASSEVANGLTAKQKLHDMFLASLHQRLVFIHINAVVAHD